MGMSKMGCACGATLSDCVCPCPTEATVIGDQDLESFTKDFTSQVAHFLDAVRDGRRESWLADHFGPDYPTVLSDAEVISDILTWVQNTYVVSITECESCGRIHVQLSPGLNEYLSFAPDVPGYHRILAAKSKGG